MDKHGSNVIVLGGRTYELVLSHRVLKRFCARHHLKISQIGDCVDDYEVLTDLLLQMVNRENAAITAAELDEMLDAVPLRSIVKVVIQAVKDSLGEDEENSGE